MNTSGKGGFIDNPQNRNNRGRPKGVSITDLLKKKLEECPEGKKETYLEQLVEIILDKAIKGDTRLIIDIIDRVDGKAKQYIDGRINEKVSEQEITEIMGSVRQIIAQEETTK